jgi:putative spermidine/putrescine transport system substrate-binding protein
LVSGLIYCRAADDGLAIDKGSIISMSIHRKITRRAAVQTIGGSALGIIAAPSIVSAQARELVVGGAASHKPWVERIVQPFFEKKYNCRIVYEGTRSLVNLEKMQKNKDKQYLSVVQMDDPVMILAVKESLLEKLTPDKVPNLSKIRPAAVHMDGMWANYLTPWQGIAYNRTALPNGVASWAEVWDAKFKGRVILPSLQNTEGLANLFIASHLATGKPMAEALKDPDPGFKHLAKLKPNLLTVYTQMPQAFNLLEQGEAWVIVNALSSFALQRKSEGAGIDLAAPKEGIFASPSGICIVKGAPAPELAHAYVNEMLGEEIQAQISGPTFSLPTNTAVKAPAGMPTNVTLHGLDWGYVADNRNDWVKRWDREMAL